MGLVGRDEPAIKHEALAEKVIVGPVRRPSEWLKSKPDRSFSDADSEGSDGEVGRKNRVAQNVAPVVSKSSIVGNTPNTIHRAVPSLSATKSATTTINPTPSKTITKSTISKARPTPSTQPAATPASAMSKFESPSPPAEDLISFDADSQPRDPSPHLTTPVFIPAGESPEAHLADAKRHDRNQKRGSTINNNNNKTAKASSSGRQSPEKKEVAGLMASRFAPKEDGAKSKEPQDGTARPVGAPTGSSVGRVKGSWPRVPKPKM